MKMYDVDFNLLPMNVVCFYTYDVLYNYISVLKNTKIKMYSIDVIFVLLPINTQL